MSGPQPTRDQGDLAEMLETLLDKGVVINADIAVSVGDTELLGVRIHAAVASFETAAEYGLAFPSGTDTARVADAAGVEELPESNPDAEVAPVPQTDLDADAASPAGAREPDSDPEDEHDS